MIMRNSSVPDSSDHFRQRIFRLDVAAWAVLGVLAALAVLAAQDITSAAERTSMVWLHGFSATWVDHLALTASFVGNVPFMAVIGLAIGLFLVYKRRLDEALRAASAVLLAVVTTSALKALIMRPRPDLWPQLASETNWSFPSGHATGSAAVAIALAVLAWNSRYRWPVVIAGAVFTVVVSWSRLYLGVHYPTDIVGGWCVAILWAYYMWRRNYVRQHPKK